MKTCAAEYSGEAKLAAEVKQPNDYVLIRIYPVMAGLKPQSELQKFFRKRCQVSIFGELERMAGIVDTPNLPMTKLIT
jgi:hypothetical protein